jgi:hypothetical protein
VQRVPPMLGPQNRADRREVDGTTVISHGAWELRHRDVEVTDLRNGGHRNTVDMARVRLWIVGKVDELGCAVAAHATNLGRNWTVVFPVYLAFRGHALATLPNERISGKIR